MMTQDQFKAAVLEHLFVRGFNRQDDYLLSFYVDSEWESLGPQPDAASFAERCVHFPGVSIQPVIPGSNVRPSRIAGARDEWLAVHEVGHALVAVRSGFTLWGARFYGDDGFPGETGIDDHKWNERDDEETLRRLIRMNVAGNMAEIVHPACEARQGLLSRFFDDRMPGDRPTDFNGAYDRAMRVAALLLGRLPQKPTQDEEFWKTMRGVVERGESEAEQILRHDLEALDRIATELRRGPMTGTAIRGFIEARPAS